MHFSKLLAEAVHSNAEFDPKWETTMSLGDHRCELAAGGDLDVFGSADLPRIPCHREVRVISIIRYQNPPVDHGISQFN